MKSCSNLPPKKNLAPSGPSPRNQKVWVYPQIQKICCSKVGWPSHVLSEMWTHND